MKKIGIITFHRAHNYGAVLQVYALQKKIEELGNEVLIIDYRNKVIEKPYKLIKLSKRPFRCIKNLWNSFKYYKINKKRNDAFEKFITQELNLTEEYKNDKQLKEKFPKFDCYITGSDQVWNTNITNGLQDSYTLNFGTNDIKKISYAASIGNSQIEEKQKEKYKEKISKIDLISVREETAKEELNKILNNKEIETVLDPTLLLKKKEWEYKIKQLPEESEKYILAYVVEMDDEYIRIVNELSSKTGLKVIHFSKINNDIKNVLKSSYTNGPLQFINLIKNAEYVICTSFHATVFSIIFNKKFFVIPHKETGSRVTDLLNKLEIKNRIYYSLDDFKNIDYTFETNWNTVNKKLEEERKKSIKWLQDAINS